MNAEEWLERYDNFTFYPEYDAYFVTKMHEAADIIRTLLAEVERLKNVIANDLPFLVHENDLLHCRNKSWKAKVDRLQSLAAARLADQEAVERHVTKRVAGECAEIAETFRTPYGSHPLLSGVQIGAVIRNKYGAE